MGLQVSAGVCGYIPFNTRPFPAHAGEETADPGQQTIDTVHQLVVFAPTIVLWHLHVYYIPEYTLLVKRLLRPGTIRWRAIAAPARLSFSF